MTSEFSVHDPSVEFKQNPNLRQRIHEELAYIGPAAGKLAVTKMELSGENGFLWIAKVGEGSRANFKVIFGNSEQPDNPEQWVTAGSSIDQTEEIIHEMILDKQNGDSDRWSSENIDETLGLRANKNRFE